jgi:hypothetical protein
VEDMPGADWEEQMEQARKIAELEGYVEKEDETRLEALNAQLEIHKMRLEELEIRQRTEQHFGGFLDAMRRMKEENEKPMNKDDAYLHRLGVDDE